MEGDKQQEDYMGQIVASRCSSGGTALYGSPVLHNEMINIEIKESSVRHDLGRDWYCGGNVIAEVQLSPAQWADFLTRMNMGDGVPCTVSWKNGHGVDTRKIPDPDPIKFGDSADKELLDISKRWKEVEAIVDGLLVKGKAGKKDLEELKRRCSWYRTSGQSTFQFLTETLIERAEKVMNAVKHEIAAIVEHAGVKLIARDISDKQLTEASKPKEIE